MNRSYTDRLTVANSERLLHRLTIQQHLHPTWPISQVVSRLCADQGMAERIGFAALDECAIAPAAAAGRLARHQICALARSMELTWQKELFGRLGDYNDGSSGHGVASPRTTLIPSKLAHTSITISSSKNA